MADRVEIRAMDSVRRFLKKNGWNQLDASHARGGHSGYDLVVQKDSIEFTIEVKGSSKAYYGIPDLYETQVNRERKLVADFLFVVYFPECGPERLAIIPRDDFPSDAFIPRMHYCIKSECKNLDWIRGHLFDEENSWTGETNTFPTAPARR
jgi:hypothetical protein